MNQRSKFTPQTRPRQGSDSNDSVETADFGQLHQQAVRVSDFSLGSNSLTCCMPNQSNLSDARTLVAELQKRPKLGRLRRLPSDAWWIGSPALTMLGKNKNRSTQNLNRDEALGRAAASEIGCGLRGPLALSIRQITGRPFAGVGFARPSLAGRPGARFGGNPPGADDNNFFNSVYRFDRHVGVDGEGGWSHDCSTYNRARFNRERE